MFSQLAKTMEPTEAFADEQETAVAASNDNDSCAETCDNGGRISCDINAAIGKCDGIFAAEGERGGQGAGDDGGFHGVEFLVEVEHLVFHDCFPCFCLFLFFLFCFLL